MNGSNHLIELCIRWMLHAGWQAAIVALIVFVFLRLSRNRISSQLRYALLLIVLVKFATPPFMPLSSGLFSQPVVTELEIDKNMAEQFAFSTVGPALPSSVSNNPDIQAAPAVQTSQTKTTTQNLPAETQTGQFQNHRAATFSSGIHWRIWLTRFYLAGLTIGSLRLVLGYWRIRQIVRRAELKHKGSLCRVVSEITTKLNMRFAPELRLSDDVDTPFATGAFNPVIVLPRSLTKQLSSDQLEIVIAHELVHIRRRDLVIGWIEVVLATIWWFHPAIWWLGRSLRQTREDCCDDVLLTNRIAEPEQYCETIIQAAAHQSRPSFEPVALGFSNPQHPAGRRIKRLMDDSVLRSDRLRLPAICLAITLALVVLPGMRQAAQVAQPTELETAQQEDASPRFMPKTIHGKIVDENGKPLANVKLRGILHSSPKHLEGASDKKIGDWKASSDANGDFQIQPTHQLVGEDQILSFYIECKTESHFSKWFSFYDEKLQQERVDLGSLALSRGVLIKGQLVGPAGGEKPIGAMVTASTKTPIAPATVEINFYEALKCDAEGRFSCVVPCNRLIEMRVAARNYASTVKTVEIQSPPVLTGQKIAQIDLGNYELTPGVSLYGTATLKNGKPAAGVVLGLIDYSKVDGWRISSTKTDSRGKYRLRPHLGKCSIVALELGEGDRIVNGSNEVLRTDGELPAFDSMEINLDGKGTEFRVDLRETDAVDIAGIVTDVSGKPVPGVTHPMWLEN